MYVDGHICIRTEDSTSIPVSLPYSPRVLVLVRMTVAILVRLGSFGMHGGQLQKSLQLLASHVNCQPIHEMRMIWLMCVPWMLSVRHHRFLPPHWKAKALWLIQLMLGLGSSVSISPALPGLIPSRLWVSLTHVINYTPRVAVEAIKFTHLMRKAPRHVTR